MFVMMNSGTTARNWFKLQKKIAFWNIKKSNMCDTIRKIKSTPTFFGLGGSPNAGNRLLLCMCHTTKTIIGIVICHIASQYDCYRCTLPNRDLINFYFSEIFFFKVGHTLPSVAKLASWWHSVSGICFLFLFYFCVWRFRPAEILHLQKSNKTHQNFDESLCTSRIKLS